MTQSRYSICITERRHRDAALLLDLHPVGGRVARWPCAPSRVPAIWIAPENSSSFSVSVVLPASGWRNDGEGAAASHLGAEFGRGAAVSPGVALPRPAIASRAGGAQAGHISCSTTHRYTRAHQTVAWPIRRCSRLTTGSPHWGGDRRRASRSRPLQRRLETESPPGVWIALGRPGRHREPGRVARSAPRAAATRPRCAGRCRLGVPFAVKDNIDVAGVPDHGRAARRSHVAAAHAQRWSQRLHRGRRDAASARPTSTSSPPAWSARARRTARAAARVRPPIVISGGSSSGSARRGRARRRAVRARHRHRRLGPRAGRRSTTSSASSRRAARSARAGVVPAVPQHRLRLDPRAARVAADAARARPRRRQRRRATRTAISRLDWRTAAAARCASACPTQPIFHGDAGYGRRLTQHAVAAAARARPRCRADRLRAAPCRRRPALLKALGRPSDTPSSRPCSMRHPEAIEPTVRSIIARRARMTRRPMPSRAFTHACARSATARDLGRDVDLLMVPTAPGHPRHDEVDAEPVALNAQLGSYTNFVNLLGWCALGDCRRASPVAALPFGVDASSRRAAAMRRSPASARAGRRTSTCHWGDDRQGSPPACRSRI